MTVTAILGALWLGLLTSISPCPLATNIAAVSYISRTLEQKQRVWLSALLYTLGRMFAYIVVAAIVVQSLLSIPALSNWLQLYMPKLIGPLLIFVGMLLVEFITIPMPGGSKHRDFSRFGLAGAFMMGFLFALAFCPVSAALFFGSLIPLATSQSSAFLLPTLYGIGSALPVVVFAGIFTLGSTTLASSFNAVTAWEKRLRYGMGALIILAGIYLVLTHTFGLVLL